MLMTVVRLQYSTYVFREESGAFAHVSIQPKMADMRRDSRLDIVQELCQNRRRREKVIFLTLINVG